MSADTVTVSPTTRFGAWGPPSTGGWGRLIRIRLGGSELRSTGICGKYPTSRLHEPHPASHERRPAASDLAARRPPRPGGVRIRRLARRGRSDVVADAPARTARSVRLAVQGEVGVRGVAGPARGAGGAGLPRRPARLPRARDVLGRGWGEG